MSSLSSKYDLIRFPPFHEQKWLWVVVYDKAGTPHNDLIQRHWAYVIGTKSDIFSRQGTRFNIWHSQRLDLDPENKLHYYQDKIFEHEKTLSTHGGCFTKTVFSFSQFARVNDETALRLHLLAHAIPDEDEDDDTTSAWTCYDWVRRIFDDLTTDRTISLVKSSIGGGGGKIGFEELEAKCLVPGVHCREDVPRPDLSWAVTEQGIDVRKSSSTTRLEAVLAPAEPSSSPSTGVLETQCG